MPEPLVTEAVQAVRSRARLLSDEQLVQKLAEQFDVSPQAMGFRLINLGIIDPTGM